MVVARIYSQRQLRLRLWVGQDGRLIQSYLVLLEGLLHVWLPVGLPVIGPTALCGISQGLEDDDRPPDEPPVIVDHPQEAQQREHKVGLEYLVMASTLKGSGLMLLYVVHQVAQKLPLRFEKLALLFVDDQPVLPQPLHHPLQVLLVLS